MAVAARLLRGSHQRFERYGKTGSTRVLETTIGRYTFDRGAVVVRSGDGDLDELLQEDLRRLQTSKAAGEANSVSEDALSGRPSAGQASSLKELIDKVLIADFFFILFALAWLGVGVGIKSSSGQTGVLDAWLSLWQWVFQPAIGVLMLGALVSGAYGWVKKKME